MHFKEKFTDCVHKQTDKQINKQDRPRTMIQLSKRKKLVISGQETCLYTTPVIILFIDTKKSICTIGALSAHNKHTIGALLAHYRRIIGALSTHYWRIIGILSAHFRHTIGALIE